MVSIEQSLFSLSSGASPALSQASSRLAVLRRPEGTLSWIAIERRIDFREGGRASRETSSMLILREEEKKKKEGKNSKNENDERRTTTLTLKPLPPLPALPPPISLFPPSAGDWLQGPYVYALYQHYGFDRGAIGRLFIAGFGSSMVFGTFVGAAADRTGRKKAALTYVLAYSLGCFTKHSASFSVLLVGRLLCGVATSLLYSAFESWLVAEHFRRGYDSDLLGGTFAKAVFIGNGLVAIVGTEVLFCFFCFFCFVGRVFRR